MTSQSCHSSLRKQLPIVAVWNSTRPSFGYAIEDTKGFGKKK